MEKKTKIYILLGVGSLLLLALDLVTKYLFYNQELGSALPFWEPVFNTGISRGIGLPHILIFIVSIFSLCLFVWMFVKQYFPWWVLALLLAGTLGNLLDRIFLGGVRDFMMIGTFPVFNVADVLLNVGVILFVLREILQSMKIRQGMKK